MSTPGWLRREPGSEHLVGDWNGKGGVIMKSTIVTVPELALFPGQSQVQGGQPAEVAGADSQATMQQKLEQMWQKQHKEQKEREQELQHQLQLQQIQEDKQIQLHWNGGNDSEFRQRPTAFLRRVVGQVQNVNSSSTSGSSSTVSAEHLSEEELAGIAHMVRSLVSEKAELMKTLQEREDEVGNLHQLLWNSQVAPSHGELTELLVQSVVSSYSMAEPAAEKLRNEQARLQQICEDLHEQLVANNIQPQYSCERPESMTARLLSLEQQLINYAKIIRKQQMQLQDLQQLSLNNPQLSAPPPQPPAPTTASSSTQSQPQAHEPAAAAASASLSLPEQAAATRSPLADKEGVVMRMEHALVMREMEVHSLQQSLATRDSVLGQRQREIAARDEEVARLRAQLDHRERELSWARDTLVTLGQDPTPPLPPSLPFSDALSPPPLSSARGLISSRARQVHHPSSPSSSFPSSVSSPPHDPSHRASRTPLPPPSSSPAADNDAIEARGAWDSARVEVREQLSRMTRSRMALYSPRPSSSPLSLFNPPAGSRKLAKYRAPRFDAPDEAAENAIVTL